MSLRLPVPMRSCPPPGALGAARVWHVCAARPWRSDPHRRPRHPTPPLECHGG
jgi:hypothetical protein